MEAFILIGLFLLIIWVGKNWCEPYGSGRPPVEPPDRGQHGGSEP